MKDGNLRRRRDGQVMDEENSLENQIHNRLREVTADLRLAREELERELRKPAKRLRITTTGRPAEAADRGRAPKPTKERG